MSEFSPSKHVDFKMAIIGVAGVGKSSLYMRFAEDGYRDKYCITGMAAQYFHETTVSKDKVEYEVWDTAGQERFKRYISFYYRISEATVIVYDITSKATFDSAIKLFYQVRDETDNVPIALVGNKSDLEHKRQVFTKEAKLFARKNNIIFFETSAKQNTNVTHLFEVMCKEFYENFASTA